ncbi:MAG: hypothetical protein JOY58_12565 [Solirubrobacterales bacterium]|nr:hypothetical protein [Solirubrobacterales bacterium]
MSDLIPSSSVTYRAIRDMGLAAWWGTSLMIHFGLLPASRSVKSPAERVRVLEKGMKASTAMHALAITAYIGGTEFVRFGPAQFGRYGVPKWVSGGVDSKLRAALMAVALGATVGSKALRAKAMELYHDPDGTEEIVEAESWERKAAWLQVVVPVTVGPLIYSHLKQDMLEEPATRAGLLGWLRRG